MNTSSGSAERAPNAASPSDATTPPRRSPQRSTRWLAIVALGMFALVAFDLWWVTVYRHNYPLTIDEAGYIAFALADHAGFQSGGVHGWWESFQSHAPYAPLVPAVTSFLYVVKAGVLEGFGVLIGFMALLTFATYGIGERLAGPRLGALAALVVAIAPGTFVFTREYVFAIAVAALLSSAVYALLRSDGLRSRTWAVASGVTLGLMLLARTMTIAFLPAVFVAAVASALMKARYDERHSGHLADRAVNLALMAVTTAAVAATWYARNFQVVFDYLTSYGYGSKSSYYGSDHSLLSWTRWRDVADRMTTTDLLVPLGALLLVGLLALAVLTVHRLLAAEDRRAVLVAIAKSDAFSVAIVFAICYVVLTSSRNGGEGFTFPISVLLPPLAVMALRRARIGIAALAVGAVLVIGGLSVASNTNLSDSLAKSREVSVPGFGSLPWIDGTPHAIRAIRAQVPGPASRFAARDRAWYEANQAVAEEVFRLEEAGAPQPVAFSSHNVALNTSSVLLAGELVRRTEIWFAQLTPEPDDSVATYERELSSAEFGMPGILVTMSRNTGDFDPLITQHYAEKAARRVGFHKVRTMTLPDGRLLRLWVRR